MIFYKTSKTGFFVFCFSFLFGSAVMAQDEFAMADKNKDQKLDPQELTQAMTEVGAMAGWDSDSDGYLNEGEFFVAMYQILDADNDDVIGKEEFDNRLKPLVSEQGISGYDEFQAWDKNFDSQIELNEFSYVLQGKEVFKVADLDQDQQLSEEEASQAVLRIMDLDNDELIEKLEYGQWSRKLDSDDN